MTGERRLAWRAWLTELRAVALEGKDVDPSETRYPGEDDADDPVVESYGRTLMVWLMKRDFNHRVAHRDFEAMLVLASERLDELERRERQG